MIISRTPFRVSFFGGGTDYHKWYQENEGAVLATTINKYCYITARYLPPFFKHNSRIIYSKMEEVKNVEDIDHPSVREVLKYLSIEKGIEIHHDGDLPARTGLGSSSSFTVGLLNALYALKGEMVTKARLAKEAIEVEQDKIGENVGCQDQTLAAYGGLNLVKFGGGHHLSVTPVTITQEKVEHLQSHMMLYFTGFTRMASNIAAHQIKNMPKKTSEMRLMYEMTQHALDILNGNNIEDFGRLLHEAWKIKKSLSDKISTPEVDHIYDEAMKGGALGGKILGAGGGGFVLLFAPPDRQPLIAERLKKYLLVPFSFEKSGSQIIFYNPNSGD